MTRYQCLDRAEQCFFLREKHKSRTLRRASMDAAMWLWLFIWAGMFGETLCD